MMTTKPEVEPTPDPIPRYSASGGPVTWAQRFTFTLWVICVLLTLVLTLVFYLIDKLGIRV